MKINTSSSVYAVIESKSNLIKIHSDDKSLAVFDEKMHAEIVCKGLNRILTDKAESVEGVILRKSKADDINSYIDRLTQENQRLTEALDGLYEAFYSEYSSGALTYNQDVEMANTLELLTELKGGEDE